MAVWKAVLALAGLVVVLFGLTLAQDGRVLVGALIAMSPMAVFVGWRIVVEVLWRRDGRPPHATVVRRRAS